MIKIRLQLQVSSVTDPLSHPHTIRPQYTGALSTFKTILREEGITVLLPSLARTIIYLNLESRASGRAISRLKRSTSSTAAFSSPPTATRQPSYTPFPFTSPYPRLSSPLSQAPSPVPPPQQPHTPLISSALALPPKDPKESMPPSLAVSVTSRAPRVREDSFKA